MVMFRWPGCIKRYDPDLILSGYANQERMSNYDVGGMAPTKICHKTPK